MQDLIERVPPHDLDAEQAVLACCLLDRQAVARSIDYLEAADFYRRGNGMIFAAMSRLFQRSEAVDVITVRDSLGPRLADVGGYGYLVDVVASTPTTAHLAYYARIVKGHSRRRQAIAACTEALDELYDTSINDAVVRLQGRALALKSDDKAAVTTKFPSVVAGEYDRVSELYERRQQPGGDKLETRAITLGLYDLDRVIAMDKAEVMLIGARPSAGKTALGFQIACHNSRAGKRGRFFSLEMPDKGIARRYLSMKTGVSAYQQLTGYVSPEQLVAMSAAEDEAVRDLHLLDIDDRAGLTVAQMRAAIVQGEQENGEPYDYILIDHLVLVRSSLKGEASGHARLSQVSKDIKQLAKDLRIPVIALTQLKRPAQGKENEEPQASELRESGSLEEDADIVMLVHRPEREGSFTPAKILLPKNRNGPVGRFDMHYDTRRTLFSCPR